MPSPFPCSPVIREWLGKKTQIGQKKKKCSNQSRYRGAFTIQTNKVNKVAGLRFATLKKYTLALLFSCKFCEIFKDTFFCRTTPVATSG